MSDGNSVVTTEADALAKKVKRNLENWREVVLLANAVLLWKKRVFPWIIFVFTSFIFMELAYYDPSILTTISLICLFLNILDFTGPTISSTLWKQAGWTAGKEKELEDISRNISLFAVSLRHIWFSAMGLKLTKPHIYYPSVFGLTCMGAWIGNTVNNLFLTYLSVLFVLMLPGLLHYGIVQQYYQTALKCVLSSIQSVTKPKIQ